MLKFKQCIKWYRNGLQVNRHEYCKNIAYNTAKKKGTRLGHYITMNCQKGLVKIECYIVLCNWYSLSIDS